MARRQGRGPSQRSPAGKNGPQPTQPVKFISGLTKVMTGSGTRQNRVREPVAGANRCGADILNHPGTPLLKAARSSVRGD